MRVHHFSDSMTCSFHPGVSFSLSFITCYGKANCLVISSPMESPRGKELKPPAYSHMTELGSSSSGSFTISAPASNFILTSWDPEPEPPSWDPVLEPQKLWDTKNLFYTAKFWGNLLYSKLLMPHLVQVYKRLLWPTHRMSPFSVSP